MSQSPTPDPSFKGLPSWLVFALLIVGPPTALVIFTRTLTANPVLLAFLIIGYEILLFLMRFTSKVWQQLEDPLVVHIGQWIKAAIQERVSHYYRHYCGYLVNEHQVFDVKGLSTRTAYDLELEQVFVDLRVSPLPSHCATNDPLHAPPSLPDDLHGTHSLWDFLSTPALVNHHLVVLGPPGSGKTTLLKHLALTLAQPKKYPQRQSLRHTFPILLFLRDHSQDIINHPDFSLTQAVQDHIQHKWQAIIPSAWIHRHLERQRCLILLDGLDEVADHTTRQKVVAWVQTQLIRYSQNCFVLTSRPYGYRENELDGVTVLDVEPFTPKQVEQFVSNWYLANELKSWGKDDLGVHQRAREGTHDLLQRLHQASALLALAVNPLLLTMIATVHRYRSSLPGKRVELYAEICEVFLGKRQEARGIAQDLSPAQKQQVLQPLAYALMTQEKREVAKKEAQGLIASALSLVSTSLQPADFLDLIENGSSLLLEKNPGIYSFAHHTFQEYLAAVHMKEEGLESFLVTKVTESWWHETIRLYCAQADATAIILACLAGKRPTIEALVLAFECDEEKLKIQPHAQTQLNTVLKTGGEDTDPERRRIISEALLKRRLRRMAHLEKDTYVSTSLLTYAEYQLFLDEHRSRGPIITPDIWSQDIFPLGHGRDAVLGVRWKEANAFCRWLTERDREGQSYRLPSRKEHQHIDLTIGAELPKDTSYWEQDGFIVWLHGGPSKFLQEQVLIPFADALALAHELDFARISALAHELDFVRVSDRALALAVTLANIRTSALALVNILDRDLDRSLANALANALDLAREIAGKGAGEGDLAGDLAREIAHAHAIALASASVLTNTLTEAFTSALEIYVIMFLFIQRPNGIFPVYEGILLIKESALETLNSS